MQSAARFLPILRWGRHYDRTNLRGDLVAGLTVSALLVPQGLAYALLAGLPPQIGLYASIAPVLAYGRSAHRASWRSARSPSCR